MLERIVFWLKFIKIRIVLYFLMLFNFTGKVVINFPEISIKISKHHKKEKELKLGFLTYLFPKKYREALIGDLIEQRYKMKQEKQALWYINLISSIHIFWVVFAMLKVRLSDLVDPEKENSD